MQTYYSDYNKNGKKVYYVTSCGRYFKVSKAEAELAIITGKGVEAVYLPWKPYEQYTDLQLSRALRCFQEAGTDSVCAVSIQREIDERKARKPVHSSYSAVVAA